MIVKENVPLKNLTTLCIGGEAKYFIEANSIQDIKDAINYAKENNLKIFVLGGGANILIDDSGFDGLVILMKIQGIEFENSLDDNSVIAKVGAGVSWDYFVENSIENGLGGLECLSGIPGTVGGAVSANIGAYGAQCSDTFISAEVIDINDRDNIKAIKKEECDFSYHKSIFSNNKNLIILSASFILKKKDIAKLSYSDYRFNLAEIAKYSGELTLKKIREAILNVREEKGVLIMNNRLSYKSAGSFFSMPIVQPEEYIKIIAKAISLDDKKEQKLRPWAWKQDDGKYKIAPGFLLEYTEFQKGFIRGRVGISPKHTLSIINLGNASSKEVMKLASDMQNSVKNIFNINLKTEVEYVGMSSDEK